MRLLKLNGATVDIGFFYRSVTQTHADSLLSVPYSDADLEIEFVSIIGSLLSRRLGDWISFYRLFRHMVQTLLLLLFRRYYVIIVIVIIVIVMRYSDT